MTDFGLEPRQVVTMRGDLLATAWPDDEGMWLAVDPGSEHTVTLAPDDVRKLASLIS